MREPSYGSGRDDMRGAGRGLALVSGLHAQPGSAPSVDDVVRRMGAHVAGYGEQASLIVAVERYTQPLSGTGFSISPRTLVAEFAVVKAQADEVWAGYCRDGRENAPPRRGVCRRHRQVFDGLQVVLRLALRQSPGKGSVPWIAKRTGTVSTPRKPPRRSAGFSLSPQYPFNCWSDRG